MNNIDTTPGVKEYAQPSRRLKLSPCSLCHQKTSRHAGPLMLCLAITLLCVFGAGLAACVSGNDDILSAEDIQATVNAIVTASAATPSQAHVPAPFTITSVADPGWGIEVVRILPRQIAIDGVEWTADSRLEFRSTAGTYQLDPSNWGSWEQAWNSTASNHQTIIPSPDGNHHILIENHMWVIRKFDGNPIGLIGDIPETVSWTSDGSAVIFAITSIDAELEQGLYAWPVGSPTPHIVLPEHSSEGRVVLSSGGSQAAYLVNSDAPGVLSLRLVDIASGEAETRQLDLPQGWQLEGWVTDELLELSLGASSQSFVWYNVESQAISQVQNAESQTSMTAPVPSPDGKWAADHTVQIVPSDGGETTSIQVEHAYFVTDLGTDENFSLAFGSDNAIEYLSWSPDSQRLYLVSCPTNEEAQAFPTAPYGLLAFDPETSSSEVLFAKAMQASLSPSQQWAYIAFPSLQSNDRRVLTGALWEVGSQDLNHNRVLLDEFVYREPSSNNNEEPAIYFYARWSHDGQRLVVVDPDGSLILYDLTGQTELLHSDLFGEEESWVEAMHQLGNGGIQWSPDDRYLVVEFNGFYLMRLD